MTGNGSELGGTFALGRRYVHRAGYGAMQLAGDGVFGPPRDRDEALRVLRTAAAAGVDHIDTAQYYGAGTVNELIREALHPYPPGLALVSKVAAPRDAGGNLFNLSDQRSRDVLAECRLRNIAFVPFCPLGWPGKERHRLLTNPILAALAVRLDATPAQVALAWLLDLAPNILLIPGTRTRAHLTENLDAASVRLDDAAHAELTRHFPPLLQEVSP